MKSHETELSDFLHPEIRELEATAYKGPRRCHHCVASSGHCVAPPWPRRMACLQRLAGTDPVSLWSWSVQRARGRPGRRLQSLPSERPDAMPTWQCRALCAGVP